MLAACLGCNAAITWVVLDKIKYSILSVILQRHESLTPGALLSTALAALGPVDVILVAGFVMFAAMIVYLECRNRAFTQLLSEPRTGIIGAGVVMVAWLGHSYLGRGYLLSGDTIAHIAMLTSQVQAIADGQSPYWTNFSYFGLPLSEYYSPTTFWPLTALDLALRDPSLSLRLFFALTYLLSAGAMAFLARELGLPRIGSLIAAMSYAGSFAHLHLLLYRGAVPQALSMVFLPLVLLFLRRLLIGRGQRAVGAWFGLALSAAGLVANYTPLAIVACVYVALFGVGVAVSERAGWRRWAAVAAAGAATGLLAAFVLLPAGTSHSPVRPLSPGDWVYLQLPTLDYFDHLLVWRAWRSNEGGGAAYLGLSIIALAAYALWSAIWRGRGQAPGRSENGLHRVTLGLGALLLLSFVLKGEHVRDIVFTLLFVSLLAGLGAARLLHSGRLGRSGAAILVGVVLLDLGSTAMQSVGRSDKGYLDAAGDYLERQTPPTRTMEGAVVGDKLAIGGTGILSWHGTELVNAGHAELATPAWIFGDIAETLVEGDLNRDGRLSDDTNALLCLLRVGRLVIDDRTHMGVPDTIPGVAEGPLGRVVKTRCAYQVVYAPRLVAMNGPRIDPVMLYNSDHSAHLLPAFRVLFDRYRSLLQLDPADGVAQAIPVTGEPPPSAEAPVSDVAPRIAVEDYAVSAAEVTADISVNRPGFVRLSHAAHRSLRIYRNGAETTTYEDPMGFIVVPVVAGENRLKIVSEMLPIQQTANAISNVTLAVLVCAGLFSALRARWSPRLRRPQGYAEAPARSVPPSGRYRRFANNDGR